MSTETGQTQTQTDTVGLALVGELRDLEQRHAALTSEIAASGTPELVPMLHPNLPDLCRRKIEVLGTALQEPHTAAEALRRLIDVIAVFPANARVRSASSCMVTSLPSSILATRQSV
ncbi:hypothetical protein JMJ56_26900 [Belnapia sp. T18]|uniref:Uncharacterized protein n=1 Tax=Belnapia arida TaxID=2804533 RepID=A0ABS1UBW3_9PROT|nr:hypothetical protein [Belnapia arida]MBL6081625.1 hypothetical protein [Belnapia arida]